MSPEPSLVMGSSAAAQDVDLNCNGDQCFGDASPFVPVNPILAGKTFVWDGNTESELPWASLAEPDRRLQLSNQDAKVAIEKVDGGVTIGYLDSGANLSKGTYRITVDYTRYKDEAVRGNGQIVGRGKVGVGVRVTADVTTKSSGLNLSGLIPIAVGFSRKKLVGNLEIRVIGIVSPEIAKIISPPTSLNEESITKAMESFGAFRVVIDQDDTRTVPHLLAVARTNGGLNAVNNTLKTLSASIS
jgi:hypothetical protein